MPAADELLFLGYQAKQRWTSVVDWTPADRALDDVCTIAECIVKPAPPRDDGWTFNRSTCYDAPAEAETVVPAEWHGAYDLLAFWLDPVTESRGERTRADVEELFPAGLPDLPSAEGPAGWEELGWDVVALTSDYLGFGCAPLSCCLLAKQVAVNRHALVDTHDEARRLVARFNEEQPEPGRYFAVRIARRPRGQ